MCDFPGCMCYLGEIDYPSREMYFRNNTKYYELLDSFYKRISHERRYKSVKYIQSVNHLYNFDVRPYDLYFMNWYEERNGIGGG